MPAFTPNHAGAPLWVDLYTSDTARARAFYGELLGWSAEAPNEQFGGYFNFSKNGQLVAGCMSNEADSGAPDTWTIHLATDDAKRTAADAVANGGRVVVDPMDVGDLGTMLVLVDPGGAVIGSWQPGAHAGFGITGEHGSPSWFELHTSDFERATAFYRDVFGWELFPVSDTPEFRYSTLGADEGMAAGIMDASAFQPAGAPDQWSVYFEVDDVDAALATITRLGGSVVHPAEPTPYGVLAAATDPTGAAFKLRTAP